MLIYNAKHSFRHRKNIEMRPIKHRACFLTKFQIESVLLKIDPYHMPKFGRYRNSSYFCTSNRKKASLVRKVGLYRRHIWVSIDVRRQTSITTQRRARNGASGELKYQPSKHTKVWLTTVLPCGQWTVTSLLSIRLNHVSTRQKREGKNPDQADINLVKTEKKNAFAVSQYSDVMTIEKFAKHIKVYCINDI